MDAISACHVLEHLGQTTDVFLAIIQELHRVLKSGGTIEIKVPHHQSGGFWGDPTHVRPISTTILSLFSKKNCRMFKEKGWPNTPLADYLDVDLEVTSTTFALYPEWAERLDKGEITREELGRAITSQWSVVDEVIIQMQKV